MTYLSFVIRFWGVLNLAFALYSCRRFLGAMRIHWKSMGEMAEFNRGVRLARINIEYIGKETFDTMEEIKEDIKKELHITDRLTELGSRIALIVARFGTLQENVIELVRMNHNTENVTIETPNSVKEEVKKALEAVTEPFAESFAESFAEADSRRERSQEPDDRSTENAIGDNVVNGKKFAANPIHRTNKVLAMSS